MRLKGRNAIVTGARTGIGRAIVELFAKEGANIWAIVHREDIEWLSTINTLATECGVWIKPLYVDLSNSEQIKQGVYGIIREKLPINILVNAAGIVSGNSLIQMTSLQTMHDVMEINFFAAVHISQLISRVMCRQKMGTIINIASIAGLDGDYAQLEYSASKAALIAATKKMAYEWGNYGIRVNAIAPGMTETKMLKDMDDNVTDVMIRHNTLGRKGKPQEVAQLALFLSGEESSYITSQVIRIDGGGTNFVSTINRH